MTPVLNTIVRTAEREADQFGINTSREPDGEAKVALKLGAYRKLDPSPLEEFIFFDHPSGRARIQMAMDWKAAHLPCGNLDAPEPASISPRFSFEVGERAADLSSGMTAIVISTPQRITGNASLYRW